MKITITGPTYVSWNAFVSYNTVITGRPLITHACHACLFIVMQSLTNITCNAVQLSVG